MKFRDYQLNIINEASPKLARLKIILLAMEVRTGKTLTSFGIAQKLNVKSVLFITKKKVIDSKTIENDYDLLNPSFELTQINYESVHKLERNDFDLIIIDESHSLGAYPKPSLRTKRIKQIVKDKLCILMTGTPTPESYSQFYHQFWISDYSPFPELSFYKWAHAHVNIKKRYVAHGNKINDYSDANEKLIRQTLSKYIISFSQVEAGFKSQVVEQILRVNISPEVQNVVEILERDLVYTSKSGAVILGDTPVKLMTKVNQLQSGTVILEDGRGVTLDFSKIEFIDEYFKLHKIAIFYKYKQEYELIKSYFKDKVTDDLEEFNTTQKHIALQIRAGREGISLRKADALVMYNIDFSAVSYWQARDRMTTKDRLVNKVFWIFSKGGLEDEIYQKVLNKKSFTTKHYERTKISKQTNQRTRGSRLVRSKIN